MAQESQERRAAHILTDGAISMTEKEFRRLRRGELVDIIFALQEQEAQLRQELEQTRAQLAEAHRWEQLADSVQEAVDALERLLARARALEGAPL